MRTTITDLDMWPTRRNGQPIINRTEEAYLFAQLIWDNPDMIDSITGYRKEILINLKYERSQKDHKLNIMMDLACRAQFYRECLEEVQRIKDEPQPA